MRRLMIAGLSALALCAAPLAHAADAPAPASTAPASSPAKVALVKRYLAAININQTMSTMMTSLMPMLMEQQRQQHPGMTEAQAKIASDVVLDAMNTDFMPKYMDRVTELYAEVFTEEELTKLVEFYESPVGRSVTAKTPTLIPRVTRVMGEMMPDFQADIVAKMCAKIDCTAGK